MSQPSSPPVAQVPTQQKRRLVEVPQSADVGVGASDGPMSMFGGVQSNNMMIYMIIAGVGISMGISIFLYREMKKMKTEFSDLSQKLGDSSGNDDATAALEIKINQLAKNMNALHTLLSNKSSNVSDNQLEVGTVDTKPRLPVPEGQEEAVVMGGGPPMNEGEKIVIECDGEDFCSS